LFNTIKKTISYLSKRQKLVFCILTFLRSLLSVLDIVGVLLVGVVAAIATNQQINSPLIDWIEDSFPPEIPLVLGLGIVLFAVFLFKGIFAVIMQWKLNKFLSITEYAIAVRVLRILATKDYLKLKKNSPSEIQVAATSATTSGFSEVLIATTTIASESVLLLLMTATFFAVDPLVTVFVLLYFFVFIGLIQVTISSTLRASGKMLNKEYSATIMNISGLITGFREIYVLGKTSFFIQKFEESRSKMAKGLATQRLMLSLPRYVIETALILGVFLFIGILAFQGTLEESAPIIGIFLVGGVRLMSSLVPMQGALVYLKSLGELGKPAWFALDEELEFEENNDLGLSNNLTIESNFSVPSISVHNVSFSHEKSVEKTISDVTLEIAAGEHVGIVGPSGSGKSTLVDIICGILLPESGEILIDQLAPREYLRKTRGIGYVTQKPGLVPGTLQENIALGVEKQDVNEELLRRVIKLSKIDLLIKRLPFGVESDLGKHVDALSGGELQRIGLARALYFRPKILVLDEATSALDAETEAAITENLNTLGENTTLIVIAHRLSTVQNLDKVFLMERGHLKDSGPFSELRNRNPLIEKYVQLMSFDHK
jgi:ATP-binding cassette subfamily C protein